MRQSGGPAGDDGDGGGGVGDGDGDGGGGGGTRPPPSCPFSAIAWQQQPLIPPLPRQQQQQRSRRSLVMGRRASSMRQMLHNASSRNLSDGLPDLSSPGAGAATSSSTSTAFDRSNAAAVHRCTHLLMEIEDKERAGRGAWEEERGEGEGEGEGAEEKKSHDPDRDHYNETGKNRKEEKKAKKTRGSIIVDASVMGGAFRPPPQPHRLLPVGYSNVGATGAAASTSISAATLKHKLSDLVVAKMKLKSSGAKNRVRYGPFPSSEPRPELGHDDNDLDLYLDLTSNEDSKETDDKKHSSTVKGTHLTPFHVATSKTGWTDPKANRGPIKTDVRDLGTPDSWISRHGSLERLSGRHPFNAEPSLAELRDGGFLTPGHLQFVRNHCAVPKLTWEDHRIEVRVGAAFPGDAGRSTSTSRAGSMSEGAGGETINTQPEPPKPLTLSMDDLAALPAVEKPITVTCIGNRRSELNAIRRSIGFSWGSGATSTSVFRGVLLRTILLKAGISPDPSSWEGCHVDLTGADVLPNKVGPGPFVEEGLTWGDTMPYGTSVPLGKVMDPARDIMVVYEQNGEPLPPDHGYPVRVIVPGCTGGRMVKWLAKIEVMPHESRNLYHYHDNKILPPQVMDLEASLDKEKRWWYRNEYIVHEMNINSSVWYPGHGDTLDVDLCGNAGGCGAEAEEGEEAAEGGAKKGEGEERRQQQEQFAISGYAYAGGGCRVTRVELSLDGGSSWTVTSLDRPEPPTPHDMSWCWIFWSTTVGTSDLASADEFIVRAWDETNNVQPMMPTWNLMGLGNNPAYRVKVRKTEDDADLAGGMAGRRVRLTFEHPTQPGGLSGGWMKEPGGLPDSAGFGPLVDPKEEKDDVADGVAVTGTANKEPIRIITEEEVEQSVAEGKTWIVVRDQVFDCDEYLQIHPGGRESIEIYKGKDCTKDFAAVHSHGARKLLEQYYIGDLDNGGVEKGKEPISDDDEMHKMIEELDYEQAHNPHGAQAERSLDELYGSAAAGGGAGGVEAEAEEDGAEGGSDGAIDPVDAVIVMEGWADILAKGEEAFAQALLGRWRVLAAVHDRSKHARFDTVAQADDEKEDGAKRAARINREASAEVFANEDILARCLGQLLCYTDKLLVGFLDAAVGSLHSFSWRRTPRYDEQDQAAMGLLEGSRDEYVRLFTCFGIRPDHWVLFCKAFLWAVENAHDGLKPQGGDKEQIEAAYAAFVSDRVARFAIRSQRYMKEGFYSPACLVLRKFGRRMNSAGDELKATFGQTLYGTLFTRHPYMLDYFPKTNMDDQAMHSVEIIMMIINAMDEMFEGSENAWHQRCHKLDLLHDLHRVSTSSYQTFGGCALKVLGPLFEQEVEIRKNGAFPVTQEELEDTFAAFFFVVASRVNSCMTYQEMIMAETEDFSKSIAQEMDWSEEDRNNRLLHQNIELSSRAEIIFTTKELEAGARLAWRNSADNFVRASWKDLVVFDRRHIDTNQGVCKVIDELLQAAFSSVEGKPKCFLAVLRPMLQSNVDIWGLRFWARRFFDFAGYKEDDGTVLGNPGNIDRTEHLVRHGLWTPPEVKSAFDLLPIIVKTPGHSPFPYTIPESLRHIVLIEHPYCEAVASLGLRWPAVDAVCNQQLRMGGMQYQCCVFTKLFLVTEVVSGLSNWPKLIERWADAMKIATSGHRFQRQVQYEMEVAVLYSFRKQGYTILDEEEASLSFAIHSRRERDAGRECPANGGFISGMHRISPRFEPSVDAWKVTDLIDDVLEEGASLHNDGADKALILPKPLILFGSESGKSERTAFRLQRALKLLNPTVMSLNDAAGLQLLEEQDEISDIFVICSTFNRGEFPHNAKKFADTPLERKVMQGKKFAVLALGSTAYPDFCRSGIALDAILAQAGGKASIALTKVDDASGSAGPISDWLELVQDFILPRYLVEAMKGPAAEGEEAPTRYEMKWLQHEGPKTGQSERFTWDGQEQTCLCFSNDELIDGGDIERSTRRIAFQLPPGCTYESGDHLAVNPLNSLDMVRRLAFCFRHEIKDAAVSSGICSNDSAADDASILARQLQQPFDIECFEGEEKVEAQLPFSTPTTLSDVLQAHLDLALHAAEATSLIALVRRAVFDTGGKLKDGLAEHTDDIQEIEDVYAAIKKKGKERETAIDSFLSKNPTIVDFLGNFPFLYKPVASSAKNAKGALVGLADILSVLSRLQPRYYSISSSPKTESSVVVISVGVVNTSTSAGVLISGVCSNYLARLRPSSDRVKVSIRTSTFRGPTDANYPVLMVGPGTGLGPMMGFLEDRAISLSTASPKPGTCHLFFGCRTLKDRIYADKIDQWESDQVLSHHLALSRSTDMPKTYVQDLLQQMGKELYGILIHEKAHFYVCGDAKVANACFEVCVDTLKVYGNKSRLGAVRHMRHMCADNRWQCDLWGNMDKFEEVRGGKKKEKKILPAKLWLKNFE